LWTKVLHDLGYLSFDEPFKKLINQGKITGESRLVFRPRLIASGRVEDYEADKGGSSAEPNIFITKSIKEKIENNSLDNKAFEEIKKRYLIKFREVNPKNTWQPHIDSYWNFSELRVPIEHVNGLELNVEELKTSVFAFKDSEFILQDENGDPTTDPTKGKYICGSAIEKMSKSYFNVVNPDQIIADYGADTLRMYEMFLGPLEASKPWSTQGIDGVFKFIRRFWNLSHDSTGKFKVSDAEPTREELKVLHKTLKKVENDIENFSFNTSVSEFMICANELSSLKCNKRKVIEPLVIALSPFAPHVAEELWSLLGHADTILSASFPKYDEQYLIESTFSYPISINGKVRAQMEFALDMPKEDIEKVVLASEIVMKWTEGKPPKKVIVVQGRIVNVVL
jgi:leucyl-tRNA synthetase